MKRSMNPVMRGILGTLVLVLAVLASLNISKLPIVGDGDLLRVDFAEAGGIEAGNDVVISGAKVGKVREVSLEKGVVVTKVRIDQPDLRLGRSTEARIVTITLLGRAAIELIPRGEGRLEGGDRIPQSRTSSPYNITSALSELTDKTAEIDKESLSQAFTQVSDTFADTPDQVGEALTGINRLATAVATNDRELRALLTSAASVSTVLADRNDEVTTLLTTGSSLLTQLESRQAVIESVLRSGQNLAVQLRSVLNENRAVLQPALTELNTLLGTLNANKKNIQKALVGMRAYALAFGEAVSSGPWFDAYIQNLTAPASLAPIISGALS